MSDSPASRNPYEVLGVSASATDEELRRAYRRLLRETHPDTGGDVTRFHAVQLAWERIGTPAGRAAYDDGSADSPGESDAAWSTPAHASPQRAARQRVRARSYGHPGGRPREIFLGLIREFAGRGVTIDDPYDPALVRSAPREIRHFLAKALAEEQTAKQVTALGMGYTIWNEVATAAGPLDHVVLGPAGLFALVSADWGSPVRLVRGEVTGEDVPPGLAPLKALGKSARALGRAVGVRFTALLIVVPDEALPEPVLAAGRRKSPDAALVRRSLLPAVLRDGLGGGERASVTEVFEVRTRLQEGIRFV